jgi:hypothetical protein
MQSLKYRKGQPCRVKPILCEEGFCSECNINLEHALKSKLLAAKLFSRVESKIGSKELVKV